MIKLQELDRRHVAGVTAVAVVIASLGFIASRDFGRRVEALSESGVAQLAQQNAIEPFGTNFLSSLRRLPADVYGSAAGLKPDEPSKPSADWSQSKPVSPASESKFWSEQEWRAASKAVADYRSGRKSPSGKRQGTLIWQPPEEIAQQSPAEKSR
jgi:hypothetical protein